MNFAYNITVTGRNCSKYKQEDEENRPSSNQGLYDSSRSSLTISVGNTEKYAKI